MTSILSKPVISFAFIISFFAACSSNKPDTANDEKQIAAMLDSFNVAAAKADYNKYFGYYTDDAIFTGTDATERWDKKAFMAWAKPIFGKGHAWDFTALERHIYFDKNGSLAWFDELLNTQMKICRGSGVLVKQGNDWKVQQYILSTTIPNEQLDSITKMKTPLEDALIKKLSTK
jgi:ketosteroid isomerase-like protein